MPGTNLWKAKADQALTRRAFVTVAIGASLLIARSELSDLPSMHDAPRFAFRQPDAVVFDPERLPTALADRGYLRLYTGMQWAEGPAWNRAGNYLVWSDIPNDLQMRWQNQDNQVSLLRKPVGKSNGNTFDWQGRQISCEHVGRRVVRYESDGRVTVLADRYQGKRLNSPNDLVVHPDGGIWFTDPTYGIADNFLGKNAKQELKEAVYRIDASSGIIALVTDEVAKPKGLCFSPDFKKLYVTDTGAVDIKVWDVVDATGLAHGGQFSTMKFNGLHVRPDGLKADVAGNLWCAGGWAGEHSNGVHILAPNGERIGYIQLPETTANLCFGGPRRDRLFAASTTSIYAFYTATQGAVIN